MCKLWHFIVIDTHDVPWARLFSAKFGKYLTPGAYINYTGLMTIVQGTIIAHRPFFPCVPSWRGVGDT